jgi:hypothetical protein
LAIVIPFTAALVVWIACIMMLGLMGSTADLPFWKAMLRAVTDSTMGIIATIVMIANTALLFDVMGDRVKRESSFYAKRLTARILLRSIRATECSYPPTFSVWS